MSAAPILGVEALSKRFRGLQAIADVSFTVEPGSITSIIGPNGAGKSTLFNLVTGYIEPSAGTVAFQGRRITGLATNRIAELGIARAFQIARPFRELSVAENVRIGALFGKAGPRDVAATTERSMDLAAIAHLAGQPASCRAFAVVAATSRAPALPNRAPMRTFSPTLRSRNGRAIWKARAMPSSAMRLVAMPVIGWPLNRTVPAVGGR